MASGSVSFPVSESHGKPASPLKAPHLPFRRISLPTAPSLLHRVSVVSATSSEEAADSSNSQSVRPAIKTHGKVAQSRPVSSASPRNRNRKRDSSVKPTDDKQAAKRRKVVDEFYETEKAYVDGLELIYAHFLTPIISSLDTPDPLLNRSALTSIFSNFIDIWNLHRSFLSALTSILEPTQAGSNVPPPNLSSFLLAHFPYLSLYTPFVTAFPSTISSLNELITNTSPQYNQRFAAFLAGQEADPRCGKLKLRDWLLTIVQRCPRYLLLLKDLINSTSKEDPEHAQLTAVHALVSKITLSLNTSLHTHAQTMALLALQKATPNLPFQLISPGRTFLKRGSLLQVERSDDPVEREFLLFSDCMVWLAPAESSMSSWDWSWSGSGSSGSGSGSGNISGTTAVSQTHHNTPASVPTPPALQRPRMTRTRSKSEAELESLRVETNADARRGYAHLKESPSTPSSPRTPPRSNDSDGGTKLKSHPHVPPSRPAPPPPIMPSKRTVSSDDKWVYKGRVELVDVQIVVGSALEDERKFEVLSPEGSFLLYAASLQERDTWTSEIRNAKAQLLASLNITNPNSTLTSSASTNHVRRVLQALPYPPSDERLATIRASSSVDVFNPSSASNSTTNFNLSSKIKLHIKDKEKDKNEGKVPERRRKVEHWVPAIWIPDGKATAYANSKSDSAGKPARACDACYESVFPLIDPPSDAVAVDQNENTADIKGETSAAAKSTEVRDTDTISSLSRLPSWLSMPALPVQRQPHPQALMDIDLNSSRDLDVSLDVTGEDFVSGENAHGHDEREGGARRRVRMKKSMSHQRLRSYHQILEDFQEQAKAVREAKVVAFENENQLKKAPIPIPVREDEDERAEVEGNDTFDDYDDSILGEVEDEDELDQDHVDMWFTPSHSLASSPASSPRKQREQKREDTTRRSKRFSLPAIALHTTVVTARTSTIADGGGDGPSLSREGSLGDQTPLGMGRSRRFSLVSGRGSYYDGASSSPTKSLGGADDGGGSDLSRGLAAARLSELLGRKTKVV
ncbi:FYVE, RhoGEF and PH domain-containing protein 6 [Psilocybe cubensis]|uniref:FYVE, RhoGEF and PH domain-containing protein 6 n=1 Tax=Psilocybe cubensis TaxID=181762 RepID=A0ACB8GWZ7_PSICU|nr:FYVE, RhoGEF and PH domain-containing protein 6 [Psilocybe cubensis]KAH9479756.1 FYVE, RhoGEF and PH domain-containing protein 6 [Psilocybe cubensis]